MNTADDIVAAAMDRLVPHIRDAVAYAVNLGMALGKEELRATVAAILTRKDERAAHVSPPMTIAKPVAEPSEGRRPPGSVKPVMMGLISRPGGATIRDFEAAGIKFNSIRGTIYALQKENLITKNGDRWYAAAAESNEAPSVEEASKR
jgi:hypothetical protein